jgi:hypothetical protein
MKELWSVSLHWTSQEQRETEVFLFYTEEEARKKFEELKENELHGEWSKWITEDNHTIEESRYYFILTQNWPKGENRSSYIRLHPVDPPTN